MGSTRQAFRTLWSLQLVVVFVTVLLVIGAVKPGLTLPELASVQAEGFLQPAAKSNPIQEVLGSEAGLAHKNADKTAGSSAGAKAQATTPPVKPDCDADPCIALTFDDGPNAEVTPKVLDILESEQVAASFFLVGRNVVGNEKLVKRMADDGFEIGNHSWDHPDFKKLKADRIREEVLSTQAAIVSAGAPLPTLFRPPYGSINAKIRHIIGMQTVLWNEDPRDWGTNDPKKLEKAILASAKPGGVIDMHDIQPVTVKALPSAIHALKKKKFQFVTVSELMEADRQAGEGKPFYGLYMP